MRAFPREQVTPSIREDVVAESIHSSTAFGTIRE
jgi:hypothetical protein